MYKFQGGGYIPGVPGRDLTNEEAHSFGIPEEGTAMYWKDGMSPEMLEEGRAAFADITDVIDSESEVEDDVDSG